LSKDADSKTLRDAIPRSSFAQWTPPPTRRDPLDVLAEEESTRIPELLPLRHQRMLANPFAFYRGSAAIMAADLAPLPVTALHVQLCGDAHVMNFGGYATPERNLVFDVVDFDETLPGPWEWDVARLCASLPLACAVRGFSAAAADEAVYKAARRYRKKMRALAALSPLEIFYSGVEVRGMLAHELTAPRTATRVKPTAQQESLTRGAIAEYRKSLMPHVRVLLDRYKMIEVFQKIVGVGSVGTMCMVAVFEARPGELLYLQLKEALPSALEAYLLRSKFVRHGERVVTGQRAIQAASDVFLGWMHSGSRDYYVRQLRDMKASLDLENVSRRRLVDYARRCGAVLARGHARSGAPLAIARYLGKSDEFETAMIAFARRYAQQVERDYEEFKKAQARPGSNLQPIPTN
jgi:uncharacterized protein (DUF2252 family)